MNHKTMGIIKRVKTSTILSYFPRRSTTLGPIAGLLFAILSNFSLTIFAILTLLLPYLISRQLRCKPIRAWAVMVQANQNHLMTQLLLPLATDQSERAISRSTLLNHAPSSSERCAGG